VGAHVLAHDFQSISITIKVILLIPATRQSPRAESPYLGHPSSDIMSFRNSAMRIARWLWIVLLISLPGWPQSVKTVLGSWEGDSKCTIPDSPCHDEHVLYQISEDKKDPDKVNIDAYKIVEGAPDFMGTLSCRYESRAGALSCTSDKREKDDWEFHILGNTMAGRLTLEDGKKLYRRITLHKVEK